MSRLVPPETRARVIAAINRGVSDGVIARIEGVSRVYVTKLRNKMEKKS